MIPKGIVGGVGFAMVALAMAGTPAFAADPAADSTSVSDDLAGAKPSVTEMTHATVTVTKINKGTRHLTVKKPDGSRQTFQVPPEIASFDKLKVGDKIDIDYGERIAVQVLPAGTKPSASEEMAAAPGMVGQTAKVSLPRSWASTRRPTRHVQRAGRRHVGAIQPARREEVARRRRAAVVAWNCGALVVAYKLNVGRAGLQPFAPRGRGALGDSAAGGRGDRVRHHG